MNRVELVVDTDVASFIHNRFAKRVRYRLRALNFNDR